MGGRDDQEVPVTAVPDLAHTQRTSPAPPAGPARTATTTDVEQLFRAHHARVLQAAFRVTGSASDAEDVLQTVFMRLLRRDPADVAALAPNPAAYLQRAAVNAGLDIVRARRRTATQPLEPLAAVLTSAAADGPEAAHRGTELGDWLRGALARLAPQSAEVFALHMFEGLSHPEIAAALDLTPNTVAVVLHRARRRLREDLTALEGDSR